jgi:hypothetical protein
VIPRIDLGDLSPDPGALFRAFRARSEGLVVRTIFAKFYVELSAGTLRTSQPASGWSRSTTTFNALIGTQPFDLWHRR